MRNRNLAQTRNCNMKLKIWDFESKKLVDSDPSIESQAIMLDKLTEICSVAATLENGKYRFEDRERNIAVQKSCDAKWRSFASYVSNKHGGSVLGDESFQMALLQRALGDNMEDVRFWFESVLGWDFDHLYDLVNSDESIEV